MAQTSNSTGSGSNRSHSRGSTSGGKKRVSLTRIRRDASVELDEETSDSIYSESDGDSDEDEEPSVVPDRKRARSSSADVDHNSARPAKYTALKSETRQIDAAVIKNKWRNSTSAAQAKVRTVLSLVERPVINANREPERRKEAQASLATLSRTMETRLPRMLFPPETKEWHFDYEAILRSNRDLERQLAAAKHSGVLARTEITKEQRLLGEAEAELEDLEKNARAEQKARLQRERGTPQIWTASEDPVSDDASHIGFQESAARQVSSIDDQQETLPFVEKIQNHLDNIENNVTQAIKMSDSIDQIVDILALLSENTNS